MFGIHRNQPQGVASEASYIKSFAERSVGSHRCIGRQPFGIGADTRAPSVQPQRCSARDENSDQIRHRSAGYE